MADLAATTRATMSAAATRPAPARRRPTWEVPDRLDVLARMRIAAKRPRPGETRDRPLLRFQTVRLLAIVVAGLWMLAPAVAHAAPTADELRATGEQLAKDGRFTEAVESFKAANQLTERASNYCLIGLAYTRRELWPQAEIFIDQCRKRATPEDPLPAWLPVLENQLAERLANVNVAAVDIRVLPAGIAVKLAVSSFAPDELFEPRTIHLPPGRHVVIATANGYADAQVTIEVANKDAQRVTITLRPVEPARPRPSVAEPARPSRVPMIVAGGGGALLAAGLVYHLVWFKPAADELATATDRAHPDPVLYSEWSHRFDVRRRATIALYGAGVAALGVAALLHETVFKRTEADVQVSAVPLEGGGGMISLGWATR